MISMKIDSAILNNTGKNSQCNPCGKSFSNDKSLNRHIFTVHCDVRKYSCEFCGKSFKRKDHLKDHVHTQHGFGLKDLPCSFCGKMFSNANLKRHVYEVHEDHKNYGCNSCETSFTRTDALKKHIRKVHKESARKMVKIEASTNEDENVTTNSEEANEDQDENVTANSKKSNEDENLQKDIQIVLGESAQKMVNIKVSNNVTTNFEEANVDEDENDTKASMDEDENDTKASMDVDENDTLNDT